MQRYFIYLNYDGTNYHGWQIQPNGNSVQEELEKALSLLLRTKTEIVGAGRTDAGVHARLMVAHFDYEVGTTTEGQKTSTAPSSAISSTGSYQGTSVSGKSFP